MPNKIVICIVFCFFALYSCTMKKTNFDDLVSVSFSCEAKKHGTNGIQVYSCHDQSVVYMFSKIDISKQPGKSLKDWYYSYIQGQVKSLNGKITYMNLFNQRDLIGRHAKFTIDSEKVKKNSGILNVIIVNEALYSFIVYYNKSEIQKNKKAIEAFYKSIVIDKSVNKSNQSVKGILMDI